MTSTGAGDPGRVVGVVKDLFFVARIHETARSSGVPIDFARTPEELATSLAKSQPLLVLMDLTTPGWDYGALFDAIDAATPKPSVLAFTTHALAATTKPFHARCDRVVTKETLTRELSDILRGVLR
jgi:CheY-like chemotaxis protein